MSPHQSNATRFYDFRQLFMFKVKETFFDKRYREFVINSSKFNRNEQVLIYYVKSFTKFHSDIVKLLTIGYTRLWILCEQLLKEI